MFDRIIGLLGLALALIFWLIPADAMPDWLRLCGLMGAGGLIGASISMMFTLRRGGGGASKTLTTARIQFYGDHHVPTEVITQNVATWYALWSPSAEIAFQDADGKTIQQHNIPKTWTIFLVFERPISARQLSVAFNAPGFPMNEVKSLGQRHAIISIAADVPAGVLDISALY